MNALNASTALTPVNEADTREAWMNSFIDAARPHYEAAGHPIPLNIRVSIGFTSTGYKSSCVAECWFPQASDDGHYELLVTPTTQTEARIAGLITHEVAHAAVHAKNGHKGHGKPFKDLATALGLVGPMQSTTEGADWYAWAAPILEAIGPMPYAPLKAGTAPPRKTSTTYTLKVECPACGWLARVTRKHIDAHSHLNCPVPDCGGALEVEVKEPE